MSPIMTRSDDLDIRVRLAEYGMFVYTRHLASSKHSGLSIELVGADHVLHHGSLLDRMPEELPLEHHLHDESVLVVTSEGKLATVLAAGLNPADPVRMALPVDARYLLLFGEEYAEHADTKITYVEIYSPIY